MNTSSGCTPSLLMRTFSLTGTSGISWPRYCTSGRPPANSIVLASISSSRVTSDSSTAFGCGEPARNTSSDSVVAALDWRSASRASSAACRAVAALPIVWATPFGSMIMITEPSPRMVLPQNTGMLRSRLDIGLTTISSVWKTPSTTMPKVWLPTCITTMKTLSDALSSPILSRLLSCTSGRSLLRSRSTAASLMRSMRCSEFLRTRTSSTTASCGIAKRSPPASTISAETMASVSGILMMKLVPRPCTDLTSMVPPI